MAYPIEVKEKAIALRKRGYSIKEVAKIIGITQCTSSLWLRNIPLGNEAQLRLKTRRIYGQYKSSLVWEKKREQSENSAQKRATQFLSQIEHTPQIAKLICALLYWAEGAKSGNKITFMNSDPNMIKVFLASFRKAFILDETKFRGLVHIHEYHNDSEIRTYWSNITGIPLSQFNKSYLKPNTSKNKHPKYKGCINVSYFDTNIARELHALYNILASRF